MLKLRPLFAASLGFTALKSPKPSTYRFQHSSPDVLHNSNPLWLVEEEGPAVPAFVCILTPFCAVSIFSAVRLLLAIVFLINSKFVISAFSQILSRILLFAILLLFNPKVKNLFKLALELSNILL